MQDNNLENIDENGFDEDFVADAGVSDNLDNIEPINQSVENSSVSTSLDEGARFDWKKISLAFAGLGLVGSIVYGVSDWMDKPNEFSEELDAIVASNSQVEDSLMQGKIQSAPSLLTNSKEAAMDYQIAQDETGVKINGVHDQIASALLSGYPTRQELNDELRRVRGAEVSAEELDVFLLAVKNNSDAIKGLRQRPAGSDNSSEIKQLLQEVVEIKQLLAKNDRTLAMHTEQLKKLEDNSGWYHNRISELEGKSSVAVQALKSKTKSKPVNNSTTRLELNVTNNWKVKGASATVAFIINDKSETVRVSRGFDIPGCGAVTNIDPVKHQVTATNCVIQR